MKKKMLLATLALLLVGTFGVTLAYYSTQKDFSNVFKTGTYGTTIKEKFVSPNNWQPGEGIEKEVVATNDGTIPIRVRAKFSEGWKAGNGDTLPLTFGTSGEKIAEFKIDGNWNAAAPDDKGVVYYYYDTELKTDETTTSFIEDSKVTFNPDYRLTTDDIVCATITEEGYTGEKCTSTNKGYAGATYTLDITIETIQAN
jgi:alternate signal-mediated exported protein